jgi:hypothetical protein
MNLAGHIGVTAALIALTLAGCKREQPDQTQPPTEPAEPETPPQTPPQTPAVKEETPVSSPADDLEARLLPYERKFDALQLAAPHIADPQWTDLLTQFGEKVAEARASLDALAAAPEDQQAALQTDVTGLLGEITDLDRQMRERLQEFRGG